MLFLFISAVFAHFAKKHRWWIKPIHRDSATIRGKRRFSIEFPRIWVISVEMHWNELFLNIWNEKWISLSLSNWNQRASLHQIIAHFIPFFDKSNLMTFNPIFGLYSKCLLKCKLFPCDSVSKHRQNL